MEQLILHLLGDYIFQNNWMANNKTKNTLEGYLAAFIHSLTYSIPFLFISSINAVIIIFVSHFLIDKYRLVLYLIRFKNWCFTNTGFPEKTPAFMYVWLMIIIDNTIHLIINYLSIMYM